MELHVNWYMPLAIIYGHYFPSPNRKSVNESRVWPMMVVALVPTAVACLTGCMVASANNDDGARPISLRQW